MQYLGIEYQMKHAPKLDPTFIPFGVWRAAYLKGATKPLAIALERDKGRVSVHKTFIHGTPEMAEADYRYVERYVKFLLWSNGGFRVTVCGCSIPPSASINRKIRRIAWLRPVIRRTFLTGLFPELLAIRIRFAIITP